MDEKLEIMYLIMIIFLMAMDFTLCVLLDLKERYAKDAFDYAVELKVELLKEQDYSKKLVDGIIEYNKQVKEGISLQQANEAVESLCNELGIKMESEDN